MSDDVAEEGPALGVEDVRGGGLTEGVAEEGGSGGWVEEGGAEDVSGGCVEDGDAVEGGSVGCVVEEAVGEVVSGG